MNFPRQKIGLQATWPQALSLFYLPIFFIFAVRWFLFEPFVIPSESMVPNLLIHDHIIVKKFSYGLKPPIGDGWLFKFREPERGDIIVFRYPENRDVFFIKRLIGLPGDKITVQNGQISVNGIPWAIEPAVDESFQDLEEFNYYTEYINPPRKDKKNHTIRLFSNADHIDTLEKEFIVPEHSYFGMGDNRDESHDSRFWGYIPEEYLVGKASLIWMSCSETLASAPFICDPLRLRAERFFKTIE
ncbi:MAG: signal peptidase I [Bdellovibrio sp.]|nr:signal peptidase I [Bdellovibrio sp.]